MHFATLISKMSRETGGCSCGAGDDLSPVLRVPRAYTEPDRETARAFIKTAVEHVLETGCGSADVTWQTTCSETLEQFSKELRYVVNHHASCSCRGMTEIRKRICFEPPSAAASKSSRTADSVCRLGGHEPSSVTIGTKEHPVFISTEDLPADHALIRSFTNVWRPLLAQEALRSGQTSSSAQKDSRDDRREVTTHIKKDLQGQSSALPAYVSTAPRLGDVLNLEYFSGSANFD